jgi:hypothetical protein
VNQNPRLGVEPRTRPVATGRNREDGRS